MKTIAFYTLGCKVNQADTASMEVLFKTAGYEVKQFNEVADVYLINTCVVTNMAQRKSRQMINRALRSNPAAVVVVTGCYPQTNPEAVKSINGVDIIIGNQERGRVVELVDNQLNLMRNAQCVMRNEGNYVKPLNGVGFDELAAGDVAERTRAFLKIQEGCNQFCTYCIIPYARGPLRSRSLEGIKSEVAKLVVSGYKEVVLIGIHLGCYGKETGDRTLYDAVQAALSVPGLQRLRLGSLESVEVEDRLLDLMLQDERFCRHLHLPLQSGCDEVLKAMHRPYDTAKFAALVTKIKAKIPDIAITTDVIVGFPGETEADFATTCDFVQKVGFAKMHIFPYSKRQGTPASVMPNQLTEKQKADRAEMLAKHDVAMQKDFMQSLVGKTLSVLFEQSAGDGFMEGLSDNYQRVKCPGGAELSNQIAQVKITGFDGDFLLGEIIKII